MKIVAPVHFTDPSIHATLEFRDEEERTDNSLKKIPAQKVMFEFFTTWQAQGLAEVAPGVYIPFNRITHVTTDEA